MGRASSPREDVFSGWGQKRTRSCTLTSGLHWGGTSLSILSLYLSQACPSWPFRLSVRKWFFHRMWLGTGTDSPKQWSQPQAAGVQGMFGQCSQAQDLNTAWCCVEPEVRFNGPGEYLQLEIFCDSRELWSVQRLLALAAVSFSRMNWEILRSHFTIVTWHLA